MSEQQTAETTATESEATSSKQSEQTESERTEQKPAETVEFWKQKAREQEKRAKDNKAAADELTQLKEAQKSDAEKSADRITQLESEVTAARTEALRFKVATQYGISDDDADLFLTGSDEESLTKQAKRLAEHADERKKNGNRVPDEGRTTTSQSGDAERRAYVRQLTGRD